MRRWLEQEQISRLCYNINYTLQMDKREYTPTKASMILTSITNTQTASNNKTDYNHRLTQPQDSILKDYEALKAQVKQLQFQNRQLSTEAQRLRYQKNINENKYLQKVSFEEETIMQFQKEKNYQIELIKLKCEEQSNRVRRQFQLRIDELQRQLKTKDYTNREFNQKNSYLQLKTNQIRKSVQTLELELIKYRQNSASLSDLVSKEEFKKKKLQMLTDQLEGQKCEMESQIHILLDIEAEKSREINSLQVRLRNSQATQRNLHEKLANLNENFVNLEHHIALMKERLLSADLSNEQGEKELRLAEQTLAMKDETVASLKEQEIRLREDLEREQAREIRRQKELGQLISQNDRLYQQLNSKKQRLHEMCISQGIQI